MIWIVFLEIWVSEDVALRHEILMKLFESKLCWLFLEEHVDITTINREKQQQPEEDDPPETSDFLVRKQPNSFVFQHPKNN